MDIYYYYYHMYELLFCHGIFNQYYIIVCMRVIILYAVFTFIRFIYIDDLYNLVAKAGC